MHMLEISKVQQHTVNHATNQLLPTRKQKYLNLYMQTLHTMYVLTHSLQ